MEENQYEETPIDANMVHERASIEDKAAAFDLLMKHFENMGHDMVWQDNVMRMNTALLMVLAGGPEWHDTIDYEFWSLTAEDLNWYDA